MNNERVIVKKKAYKVRFIDIVNNRSTSKKRKDNNNTRQRQ